MPLPPGADAAIATLAVRAATALCDLFARLFRAKDVEKRRQLEEFVEPAFAKFGAIEEEYERAFRDYRTELGRIDSEEQITALIARIEGDLRFTARARIDLQAQLEHAKGSEFEPFVRTIVAFLVHSEESATGNLEDFGPRGIVAQVHRRALIEDLRSVLSPWAGALDPSASAPPLQRKELEQALRELGSRHGIAARDPKRDGKLRAALGVERLDARFDEMMAAYERVRVEYEALRQKLTSRPKADAT